LRRTHDIEGRYQGKKAVQRETIACTQAACPVKRVIWYTPGADVAKRNPKQRAGKKGRLIRKKGGGNDGQEGKRRQSDEKG